MARTELPVNRPAAAGMQAAWVAATADGFYMSNDGRTVVEFENTSGGAITVTFVTPGTVDSLAIPDRTVSVPTGGDGTQVGRLRTDIYNQPAGGANPDTVYINFSSPTSVRARALGC